MTAFRSDAAVWALTRRDRAEQPPPIRLAAALEGLGGGADPVDATVRTADTLLRELAADPRSYLITHLTPLLSGDGDAAGAVAEGLRAEQHHWSAAYGALMDLTGAPLRAGWTPHRVALTLQAMVSGFLVHQRVQPADYECARTSGHGKVSLFADSVLAFLCGVLDLDRDGHPPHEALRRKWTTPHG
ncbi:hypothetical protein [Nocardiopsis trehalosi]|uniref:hypothetical protein n=1 Tax=Nocardiopsis trehalosi TaxID=109329 RepID=UPI0008300BE3|nr:hypothetical protein [Nocardiopsis trehalosi]